MLFAPQPHLIFERHFRGSLTPLSGSLMQFSRKLRRVALNRRVWYPTCHLGMLQEEKKGMETERLEKQKERREAQFQEASQTGNKDHYKSCLSHDVCTTETSRSIKRCLIASGRLPTYAIALLRQALLTFLALFPGATVRPFREAGKRYRGRNIPAYLICKSAVLASQ